MIIFPMVGKSSRFFKAGYKLPKYQLPIGESTVFEKVVLSFERYFNKIELCFVIYERGYEVEDFIKKTLKKMQISYFRIVSLENETRGQAETVKLALDKMGCDGSESLTIFNIDTFRPGFKFPDFLNHEKCSFLETFIGSGKNWSNVVPKEGVTREVKATYEKEEASEFCCTGLYYWEKVDDFLYAYDNSTGNPKDQELYVAPMYNTLIRLGKKVKFTVIAREQVVFCGVPEEYEALCENSGQQ